MALDVKKPIPLRVIDPVTFRLVAEIDAFSSLVFSTGHYQPGSFSVATMAGNNGVDALDDGAFIMLGQDGHRAGFIDTVDESETKDGYTVKVAGKHTSALLHKRTTYAPTGQAYWRMTGPLESVMKALVDYNAITPTDTARIIPGLTLAPDQGRGPTVTVETRGKYLDELLTDLGLAYDLGWEVFVDWEGGAFVFDVKPGTDRSRDNTQGNSPVIFSPDFNNLVTRSRKRSTANYRTAAQVGGQGEGADRTIIEVGGGSGLARAEVFIDARDVQDPALLPSRGAEKLASDFPATDVMNMELQPTGTFVLDVDFYGGDVVAIEDAANGWQMAARIFEDTVSIEKGGLTLAVKIGKDMPTITDFIKRQAPKA